MRIFCRLMGILMSLLCGGCEFGLSNETLFSVFWSRVSIFGGEFFIGGLCIYPGV